MCSFVCVLCKRVVSEKVSSARGESESVCAVCESAYVCVSETNRER